MHEEGNNGQMRYIDSARRFFDRLPWALIAVISLAALLVVGALDYFTGEELGLSIFYAIPVMLMAWYMGRTMGFITSFTAALIWYIADIATGRVYSNAVIPVWNAGVRLGFFLIIAFFLSSLRDALEIAQELSRMDPLTGAVSTRYFYELAGRELERAGRYGRPLSVAYMDLDNFKEVNDVYGHTTGDELLRFLSVTIRDNIRKSDIFARLGGDEFAVLLPETGDDAGVVMEKLRSSIVKGMPEYRFPVTLSVGVITYIALPETVEDMIREVDELMYAVKNTTKNAVRHMVIESEADRQEMIRQQVGHGCSEVPDACPAPDA